MNRTRYCSFLILFIVFIGHSIKAHGTEYFYDIFCYDKAIFWRQKILVGCEIVDCCPGCPKKPIELRLDFKSQPGITVLFKFENVTQDLKKLLKLSGNIRWVNDDQLEIGGGVSSISGFEPDTKLLISPSYKLSDKILEQKKYKARLSKIQPLDSNPDSASFSIKKLMGIEVIFDQVFITKFLPCFYFPGIKSDQVTLLSNTGDDPSVIITDGRKLSCENDGLYFQAKTASVGNFLTNDLCNAETFVFSKDNAMPMISQSSQWTNNWGDVQKVQLGPLIDVPVAIWLILPGQQSRAQSEVNQANLIFNATRAGLRIVPDYRDISADVTASSLLGTSSCSIAEAIRRSAFYVQGKINVYYSGSVMDGVNTITAACCLNESAEEVILISPTAHLETLTHELGHSFSLSHTNGMVGFDTRNIMYGGGSDRWDLTEGQDFRINVNCQSTLNTLGFRAGQPTRNCPDGVTNTKCLALSKSGPN